MERTGECARDELGKEDTETRRGVPAGRGEPIDLESPICGDEDVCKETLPRGDCSGVCTFGDKVIGTDACIGGDARGERTFTGECVPLGERVPPGETTRGGE